ncbi:MAG: prepilin peptidase [Alphaproteobacteria bacterium]|nr:prepilin peptidase [Alphaproteobacteria bacterium]
MLVFPYEGVVRHVLVQSAPGIPSSLWWATAIVVLVLALTALHDIRTTTIPEAPIFLGLLALTGLLGMEKSWPDAAMHLRHGIEAGLAVWAVNFMWRLFFKNDALGMGDAKWSMLAAACFGLKAVIVAWGIGACLAVLWIAAMHIARRRIAHVTFAPFLCAGLAAGIYALRFADMRFF